MLRFGDKISVYLTVKDYGEDTVWEGKFMGYAEDKAVILDMYGDTVYIKKYALLFPK